MDNGGKRKRDSDQPRITYHTADRTFDRLFKEKSLNEMKSVVRQKLGLSPVASIHLAQLREDKRIDLEDDDDFDAFLVVIHSTSLVNVMVTWSTEVVPTTFTELVTGDHADCSLPKTTPIGASTKFPTTSRDSPHANDRTLTPVQPDPQSPPPKRKKRKVDLVPGNVTVEPKDGLSQIAQQGAVTVASSIPNTSVQDRANVLEGNISISAPPVPQKASQIRPTAGSASQRHTRSSLKLAQAAAQTELPKGSRDTSRKTKEFPSQLADAIVKSTVGNNSAKVTVMAGKSKGGKKRPIKKASPAAELEGASNTSKDREKLTGNTQQPCTGICLA
ncbi:hypothetical protein BD779DRAFT_968542 [Infundibulicybe gibba]|nr:hypothetical protein BD779DRAFT_968542 [Infundibulicybe gibba]